MSIEISKKEKFSVVKINSEKLDSLLAPSLKSELIVLNNNGIKNIIIDLSATRYCDSSGLSAILIGNRLCKGSEGAFVLASLQDPVKKVISISQLDSILNISKDMSEAEAMF
jgi:anti-anti-sigma factor